MSSHYVILRLFRRRLRVLLAPRTHRHHVQFQLATFGNCEQGEFSLRSAVEPNITIQSISVIRPAFLEGENGPYKQIGPVSSTHIQCLQIEKLT